MPPAADDRYLRYVLARMSAFRNIWWSLANEYDLMKAKSTQDFDRFFHIVQQHDPVPHLRSIHYSNTPYDYARPYVTHACMQSSKFDATPEWLALWRKPLLFDEVQYEGNLNRRWGNLSGEEMTRRFWLGVIGGAYVTHGENYLDPNQPFEENSTPTLWWSHGGTLHGASPTRIAFLRKLVEETAPATTVAAPAIRTGLDPQPNPYYLNATALNAAATAPQQILYYMDYHQPIYYEFPLPEGTWTAELIDPWEMKITPIPGTHTGKPKLKLAGRPYQALRFRRV
jgi:hypothetical protein